MTNSEIYIQILSEALNRPIEDVKQMTDLLYVMAGKRFNLDETIPDDKAQELLVKLRAELPGIRAWLVTRGLMMEADIAGAHGHMH